MKCIKCSFQEIPEDAIFCPNCGWQLQLEQKKDDKEIRLKLLGGESRIVTLFFIDFIIHSDIQKTPIRKENVIYLDEMMRRVEEIIKKFDGTVNRIMADNQILAIFGAPKAHGGDPERAINCALKIKKYCLERKYGNKQLDCSISIGVNTGWIFLGDILEKPSFLTIIGDTVNIAARLAQMAPLIKFS